jgi:hypothetical protein
MKHPLRIAALLAPLCLGLSGCVLFLPEGLVGFSCGFDLFEKSRGFPGIDPCDCGLLCTLGGPGGSLIDECFEGESVFEVCYAKGPQSRRFARGAGVGYTLPPDAYFALGSYQAGAETSHQIGLGVAANSLETFSGTVTYPPEFGFAGFGSGPVGTLALDLDGDGAADAAVPLIGIGADLAFADLDFNGLQFPGVEPTVSHAGTHVFTLAMPAGGDRNLQTIASTAPVGLTLTLLPGVLQNPATPGAYQIEGDFTSVDPDTDGADDTAGDPPLELAADQTVQIGDGPCPAEPAPGCNASFAKATLSVKNGDPAKDAFRVKAKKGVTGTGFFGDPTDATSHATCVYDGGGALLLELPVAAGGTGANGKPLWKRKGEKATYKDKAGVAGGVAKVGQRSGKGAGFDVSARGTNLVLPTLPVTAPITVQHRTLDGGCGAVVFDTLTKNDAAQLKATVK